MYTSVVTVLSFNAESDRADRPGPHGGSLRWFVTEFANMIIFGEEGPFGEEGNVEQTVWIDKTPNLPPTIP